MGDYRGCLPGSVYGFSEGSIGMRVWGCAFFRQGTWDLGSGLERYGLRVVGALSIKAVPNTSGDYIRPG